MSYASEVAADSPVAWYRMQESSGLIQDSSGNANHASASTGTAAYAQTGPITSEPSDVAINFSGDDYFSVPDHTSLDVGDTFTYEAWVKRNDTTASGIGTILSKGANSPQLRVRFDLGGDIELVKAGLAVVVTSTVEITDATTWHHVVCTKTGSTVKLYIDGVDRTGSVSNQTMVNTAVALQVGASSGSEIAKMHMDEVAVYSTALSAARVSAHYAAASVTTHEGEVISPFTFGAVTAGTGPATPIFPVGAILLDDFTRANEGPPPSAAWSAWLDAGLEVVSNQLAPDDTGGNNNYHRMAMPSADVEAYVTIATLGVTDSETHIFARLDPALVNAYSVVHKVKSGTDEVYLLRWDAAVASGALGTGPWNQNLSAGDKIGIRCEGSSIQAWVYTAGAWTRVGMATDATHSGLSPKNKVALHHAANGSSTARFDDFYAGTTVAQATPTLTVYLGDNANWTAEPSSWTDITADVLEASWSRGRQRELDEVQAGSGSLRLDNRAREYDPSWVSGSLYPLRVMRQVKIEATLLGVTYPMFRGFITAYHVRWQPEWESGTNAGFSETTCSLVDGITVLANSDAVGIYTEKTAEERVSDILTNAGWPSGLKSLSADGYDVIAKSYAGTDGARAWEMIQEATRSGAADTPTFIDGSGIVRREGSTATGYVLGDAGGEIRYSSGDAIYDVALAINIVIVEREDGTPQVYANRSGNPTTRYGARVYERSTLNVDDADALALATAIYNLRSEPVLRPESVQVRPGYKPIPLAAMLDLELQDTFTLKRRPPGSGTITQTVAVAGLAHQWSAPGEWNVTYRLAGTTV